MRIRAARPEDAAGIHAMLSALARDVGLADQFTSRPEDFRHYGFEVEPPAFRALIAERGAEPLGICLYFYSFSSWGGRRGVYVQDIYVAPQARGTGLGRRLMAATARAAARGGAVFMRLAVDRDNRAAQEFYRGIGMQHADRDCIFKAWNERFEALLRMGGEHEDDPA